MGEDWAQVELLEDQGPFFTSELGASHMVDHSQSNNPGIAIVGIPSGNLT